MGTDVQIAE